MKDVTQRLVEMQYERNDIEFNRGKFRVKGDTIDIFPAASSEEIIRLEFFGDEIDSIRYFNPTTQK